MLRVLRAVLPQLVRNRVVQGIESPFERVALGKPEQGLLQMAISKRDDGVTQISIKHDGRGVTLEIVKKRLEEMGVITGNMSNGQIMQPIFEPQFSTAIEVTVHAGRGVGLALVKESLEKAGAKLKVNTSPGHSTEFVIHFGRDA